MKKYKKSVYALLLSNLEQQLETGAIAPGSRLPSEKELAVRYRISRPSVRMALDLLQRDGKIVSRPGKGSFACDPDSLPAQSNLEYKIIGIAMNPWTFEQGVYWYEARFIHELESACRERRLKIKYLGNNLALPSLQECHAFLGVSPDYSDDMVESLAVHGMECVLFNRISEKEKLAYVAVNYRREAERAVIRFMKETKTVPDLFDVVTEQGSAHDMRARGYVEALGNKFSPDRVCKMNQNELPGTFSRMIERHLTKNRPNSVFLTNGSLLLPLIGAAGRLGLRIDTDLKVLCFDDVSSLCDMTGFRVHYIAMPLAEMACDAVHYLADRLESPRIPVLKKIYTTNVLLSNDNLNGKEPS